MKLESPLGLCKMPSLNDNPVSMKKITFLPAILALFLFSSCGGNNSSETEVEYFEEWEKYDIKEVASSMKDAYSKWGAAAEVIAVQDSIDMSDDEGEEDWETMEADTSISCRASLDDLKEYFTQNYPGRLPDLYYINAEELVDFGKDGTFKGSGPDTSSTKPEFTTNSYFDPNKLPTSAELDSPEKMDSDKDYKIRVAYEQFDKYNFDRRFFCIVEVILNMEPKMEKVGHGFDMGSFESGMMLAIVNLYDSEENALLCRKVVIAESSETISYAESEYSDGSADAQRELDRDYRSNCQEGINKAIEGFKSLIR